MVTPAMGSSEIVAADPQPTGMLPVAPSPVRHDEPILPPRVSDIRVNESDILDHVPHDARMWTGVATGLVRADEVHVHPDTRPTAPGVAEWWTAIAAGDARAAAAKAQAYGSNSLMEEGRKIAKLQGRAVSDAEALELGCWNYATGKVARWSDAVMRGEQVGDDTLLDLVTYAMMTRRVRAVGNWPD